jgi:hypothetical protein
MNSFKLILLLQLKKLQNSPLLNISLLFDLFLLLLLKIIQEELMKMEQFTFGEVKMNFQENYINHQTENYLFIFL